MQKKKFKEFELSSLMLGTVQFGLAYGLANQVGKLAYDDVKKILTCAYEGGVNCLDTAAGYMESEEVIGKALSELGIADKMVIETKVDHMPTDLSQKEAHEIIENSVTRSLKRLRLDTLPICLLHIEENFPYIDSLLEMKEKGYVQHVGCSTMTPDGTRKIIQSGLVEAVQIPSGILDQRFTGAGIVQEAADRDVAVFVRSIYLQGLVLMPDDRIPEQISEVKPVLQQLRALAAEADMSLIDLAVRYVLSINGVTCALAGIDTVEQMSENVKVFSQDPLPASMIEDIQKITSVVTDHITNPQKWGIKVWPTK